MKEIGERLRETRLSIGISIEEAAQDLKLMPSQIEEIETGNIEAFKDIFYLKYFIKDYSKYLGLNYEDMVDEFNEYLFDYTSKISIEDIKKAKKNKNADLEEKKVASPYTVYNTKKKSYFVIGLLIILILIIMYGVYYFYFKDKHDETVNVLSYDEIGGYYELT
ncbi:MAG: helix-turn-helix domain-containing protein [Bacilli bacterium]|nr:helix-turn-helix domain-containing protein [Bacilli bacterium]